jgi:hypothetical protein
MMPACSTLEMGIASIGRRAGTLPESLFSFSMAAPDLAAA